MMARYYDEKTPQCDGCGWHGQDTYPAGEKAGQTYERCGLYGYILHRKTEEKCEAAQSPRMVQIYIDAQAKKTKNAITYNREKGGIELPLLL